MDYFVQLMSVSCQAKGRQVPAASMSSLFPVRQRRTEQKAKERKWMLKRMLWWMTYLMGILGSILLVVGIADWIARLQ